jgi:hypothetical protein
MSNRDNERLSIYLNVNSFKWKSITKHSLLKRFSDWLSFVFFFTFFFICCVWIIVFYLYFKFLRTNLLTFFNDIMSFHIIDFELYENEILMLHQGNRMTTQIVNHLNENYQVKIIYRIIKRRIRFWNITIKQIKTNNSSKLRMRIAILFFQNKRIDEKIIFFRAERLFYWSLKIDTYTQRTWYHKMYFRTR